MKVRHFTLSALIVVPAAFFAGCATEGYGRGYGYNNYRYSSGYGYSSPYRSYGYGYQSYRYRYGYPTYGYRYGYPYGFGSYGYYGSPFYGSSSFSVIIGGRHHRSYSRGHHHRGRRGH